MVQVSLSRTKNREKKEEKISFQLTEEVSEENYISEKVVPSAKDESNDVITRYNLEDNDTDEVSKSLETEVVPERSRESRAFVMTSANPGAYKGRTISLINLTSLRHLFSCQESSKDRLC